MQVSQKMAGNNLEDINFQLYVDGLKQKKISWNFFIKLIEDLCDSNIERLCHYTDGVNKEFF